MTSMHIWQAVSIILNESGQPIFSDYDISVIIFNLYKDKALRSDNIRVSKPFPNRRDVFNTINSLNTWGIILPHKDFTSNKAFKLASNKEYDVGEVACCIDPFAYVSHLSAMSYHALTNRIPSILYISTPPYKEWVTFARKKMLSDMKDNYDIYVQNRLPKLTKIAFDKIDKYPIIRYSTTHLGAYKNIKGKKYRVSTIGRTFLDMVREPKYCGGMRHVIEVYKEFSIKYKNLIIDEADRNGNAIEKVRIGYLLEELCNIRDEKIDKWVMFAQRGGSRKLDPNGEFTPNYSERWCISLNVDGI